MALASATSQGRVIDDDDAEVEERRLQHEKEEALREQAENQSKQDLDEDEARPAAAFPVVRKVLTTGHGWSWSDQSEALEGLICQVLAWREEVLTVPGGFEDTVAPSPSQGQSELGWPGTVLPCEKRSAIQEKHKKQWQQSDFAIQRKKDLEKKLNK